MCEFISWVEKRGKCYFLTGEQIFSSEEGQAKLKKWGVSPDDYSGHGTIREWYGIDALDGSDKECTDFSTPDNFPAPIVASIKDGKFKGFAFPKGLLIASLYADYWAKIASLNTDCESKRASLYADYKAKIAPLYADYESKRASLNTDYESKRASLYADYKAKIAPLYADYESKRASLNTDYESKRASLYADYWDLFLKPENRNPKWR